MDSEGIHINDSIDITEALLSQLKRAIAATSCNSERRSLAAVELGEGEGAISDSQNHSEF